MKYCSTCGSSALAFTIPKGDTKERYVCANCHTIYYTNPHMVVGCVVQKGKAVLLAKRGIEPRKGYWNLPCGFLENNETIQEGAVREVFEETRAQINLGKLHTVYNVPHANQVYLIFKATMVEEYVELTEESTEIEFFEEHEIPWQDIAFSSNTFALKRFFNRDSEEKVYVGTYRKPADEN